MLILMLAGALHAFLKQGDAKHTAVPWLSFFGLLLLLTIWEVGGRLTMNHFPMLVIGAIIGLSIADPLLLRFRSKIDSSVKKKGKRRG